MGIEVSLQYLHYMYPLSPFLQAYHRKMYGSKYVWVIMQGLPDNWYINGDDIPCNSTELLIASEGFFTATRSDIRTDEKHTIFSKVCYIWIVCYLTLRLLKSESKNKLKPPVEFKNFDFIFLKHENHRSSPLSQFVIVFSGPCLVSLLMLKMRSFSFY